MPRATQKVIHFLDREYREATKKYRRILEFSSTLTLKSIYYGLCVSMKGQKMEFNKTIL